MTPKQLQVMCTDVRYQQELFQFIEQITALKEPYHSTSIIKFTFAQDILNDQCIGLFVDGQLTNDPIHGLSFFRCCFSNAFKLKQGHYFKIQLVDMMIVTTEESAECRIRLEKGNPY